MEWSFVFFLNSALLGVGLAMDAFSVSLANGLHDPYMSRRRGAIIAGTFGVFQAVMPMTGWLCVHTIVELFSAFERFVPWIALALLGYIGGKMLMEGIKGEEAEETAERRCSLYAGRGHQYRRSFRRLHHLGVRLADGTGLLLHRGNGHVLHL